MIVGLLKVTIYMNGISSLKEKRSIVKSLVERLRSRFNVSASEIDRQDTRTAGVIGIAVVSNETDHINQSLNTIINFIQNDGRFYITNITREIFPHSE